MCVLCFTYKYLKLNCKGFFYGNLYPDIILFCQYFISSLLLLKGLYFWTPSMCLVQMSFTVGEVCYGQEPVCQWWILDKTCSRWAQSFQSGLTLIKYQLALLLYLISCHIHTLSVLAEGVLKWNLWSRSFTHFFLDSNYMAPQTLTFKKKKVLLCFEQRKTKINYWN